VFIEFGHRQSGEQIGKILDGFQSICFGGHGKTVQDHGRFGPIDALAEHPVFPSGDKGANSPFDGVVVRRQQMVSDIALGFVELVLSGKCNDPGSARELTHLNPSRL
jgi:hypothetical protein